MEIVQNYASDVCDKSYIHSILDHVININGIYIHVIENITLAVVWSFAFYL